MFPVGHRDPELMLANCAVDVARTTFFRKALGRPHTVKLHQSGQEPRLPARYGRNESRRRALALLPLQPCKFLNYIVERLPARRTPSQT